jgi:Zn-dependent protease/predicted transcriptional regulator
MNPKRGIDLFRVAGIQIAVDYSWLVIFTLVLWSLSAGYFPAQFPGYAWTQYWGIGLVATLLFFTSVVLHELSHSIVANALGQEVKRITLFIFGGMAHLTREPRDARTELLIAAAGPVASFAIGGAFWLAMTLTRDLGAELPWVEMFRYLAIVNVALAVFNLLPGFPLDGGRLLRALVWMRTGDFRKATASAANWGSGIAIGLMILGVLQIFAGALIGGLWLIFIGMFLRGAAQASYHGVVVEHVLSGATAGEVMVRDPVVIPGETTVEVALDDYFLRHGFGGFPVVVDGRIDGIVSLGDVKSCPREERPRRTVRDIMRPADAVVRIAADASVAQALRQMVESGNGRLLVVDGNRVAGLITNTGILRFTQLKTELEEQA